ncbi:unnamed protein product, partial [Didymodactylos carnosus]
AASACTGSCGNGTTVRTRNCNSPSPAFGGLMCQGQALNVTVCSLSIGCPVSGDWAPWSNWTTCSVTYCINTP